MEYANNVDEPLAKEKELSASATHLQPCSGSSTPRQHDIEKVDNASASKEEGAQGSSAPMDLSTRKHGRATVSTVERQLQNVSVENPTFEEVPSQSGQRRRKHRQKRRVISGTPPTPRATPGTPLYTSQGVHIASNIDACDCMEVVCPGCHFPCPKCGSSKCGDECRCNRTFVDETLQVDDGYGEVLRNPLLK